MIPNLDSLLAVLQDGGADSARSWLTEQTARPLRASDRAMFDALTGFVSQVRHGEPINAQRVPATVYPFLVAASLSEAQIAGFYGDHPIPQWRLRFPVVLSEEQRLTIKGLQSPALAIALSPDGTHIAVSAQKSGVRIWRTADLQPVERPMAQIDTTLALCWLDNERLLMGCGDGHVHIWSLDNAQIDTLPHKHHLCVRALATDGVRFITVGDDGLAAYWATASKPPLVLSGQVGRLTAAAICGEQIIVGTHDGSVCFWDLAAADTAFSMPGHEGAVTGCAFVPDTQLLLTTGMDGRLIAWETAQGTRVYTLDADPGPITTLAVNPTGTRALTGHANNQIQLYDLVQAEPMGVFLGHRRPVSGLAFSTDTQHIWSGSHDRTVRQWHMSDLRHPGVALHHSASVRSVDFSPDACTIASGSRDGSVQLWSVGSGRRIRSFLGQKGGIYCVRISASGERLASVSTSGRIVIWHISTGEIIHSIPGDGEAVTCCAFPNDDTLVTGGRNLKVQVWNLELKVETHALRGHTEWVRTIAVHPDGRHILSGAYDNDLRIWDLSTGSCVSVLQQHTRPVVSTAISPDGNTILSLGLDGKLIQWRWSDASVVRVIDAHDGPGAGLALIDDGHVVTVGHDSWVRTFDIQTGLPVHQLPLNSSLDSIATTVGMAAVGDRRGNLWLFDRTAPINGNPTTD